MNRLAALTLAASLLTMPLSAGTLRFRVTLTDARTAFRASPDFEALQLTEEQLREAARSRVLLLDRTSGTKWRWLMLSWLEEKPDVEHGIGVSGTAPVGKGADVGLKPIDRFTLEVRCLHERCTVVAKGDDGNESTVALKNDESTIVVFGSELEITFPEK